MVIYIEYLLIDNLIINSNILFLTASFLGYKIKFKNVIALSVLATMFTFLYPYIALLKPYFVFLIKLAIGMFIVLFFKKFFSLKEYIACYLIFISSTFVLGGEVYGLINMLNLKTGVNGLIFNYFEIPVGLIVGSVNFYMFLLLKLIKYSKNKMLHSTYFYDVFVCIAGEVYKKLGVYDTCNCVYDNISNKPVLIISPKFYKEIVNKFKLLNNFNDSYLKNKHYISIKTISNTDKILVFDVDFIKIFEKKNSHIISDVCVGVSKTNLNDFDCIIHKSFLT